MINSTILKRLAFIDKRFQGRNYVKTSSLANDYEVSEKTIYRDLELLKSEFDAPIEYDSNRKSFHYTKPFKLSSFDFTINELYNLAIIRELIKSSDSNPFKTGQKSLFNKIVLKFDDDIKKQIQTVSEKISFNFKPARKLNEKIFKVIERALLEERTVRIIYFNPEENSESERTVDPYHLRNYEGDWYLIGYNHLRQKVRIMAVNRIRKIILTNNYFDIPESFNVKEYFKDSFRKRRTSKLYEVKIEVYRKYISQLMESKIHSSQKIQKLRNGNIIIRITVNDLLEIKDWILTNSKKIKLNSPRILIDQILNDAQDIISKYK